MSHQSLGLAEGFEQPQLPESKSSMAERAHSAGKTTLLFTDRLQETVESQDPRQPVPQDSGKQLRVAEGLSSYCSPGIRKAPFSGLHASQVTQIRWNKIPQNLLFWEGQGQCLLSSGCCILHTLWTRIAIKEEESKASHGHEWNCLLIIKTKVLVNAAYVAKRIPNKGSQHSVGIRMVPFCIVCKPMHRVRIMK